MNWTNILTGAGIVGNTASTLITNEYNRRAQERQNRWNLHLWDLQNQYNSPVEQMKRLQAAGLNPDMMYGGNAQTVGNASSQAVGTNPIAAQAPQIDPLMFQQIDLMKAQKYKTLMEGKGQDIQNEIMDKTGMRQAMLNLGFTEASTNNVIQNTSNLHTAQDKMKEEIENVKTAREQMKVSIDKTLQETQNLKATEATEKQALHLLIAQTEGQKLSNEQQKIINEWLPKKYQQEIAEGYKRMEVMDSEIVAQDFENAYTYANTLLTGEKQKTEKKTQKNIDENTNLVIANRVGVQIDNKTRDVKNKVEIAQGIVSGFKDLTQGIYNIKETFWSSKDKEDKDKKTDIGKTVKGAYKAYKVASAVVK